MGNSHSIPTHFREVSETSESFLEEIDQCSNLICVPSLSEVLICVNHNVAWMVDAANKTATSSIPITWNTPRNNASIAALGNDKIIGFGGLSPENTPLSTVFVLQLVDGEEGKAFVETEEMQVVGKVSPPTVSFGFSFDYIGHQQGGNDQGAEGSQYLIYGGQCVNFQSGEMNMNSDAWKLMILEDNQYQWEIVYSESKMQPEARMNHGSAVVGDEIIFLFGETVREFMPELIKEVWSLNLMTCDWTLLNISGSGPKHDTLSCACTGVIGSDIVMFGGNTGKEVSNQVFILTNEDGKWIWVGAHLDSESKHIPHRHQSKSGVFGHNLVIIDGCDEHMVPCAENQVFCIEFDVDAQEASNEK